MENFHLQVPCSWCESDDEPVMMLNSEDDVVRHKKKYWEIKISENCTKMR